MLTMASDQDFLNIARMWPGNLFSVTRVRRKEWNKWIMPLEEAKTTIVHLICKDQGWEQAGTKWAVTQGHKVQVYYSSLSQELSLSTCLKITMCCSDGLVFFLCWMLCWMVLCVQCSNGPLLLLKKITWCCRTICCVWQFSNGSCSHCKAPL